MFPQFVSREATSFILGNELGHSERLSFSEACQELGWHCGVNRTASAIPDPVDPVSEGRCSHWLRGSLMHDNTEKINMAMDQYLWKYHLLGGWTSILTQLNFDVNRRGTIGFDTLPCAKLPNSSSSKTSSTKETHWPYLAMLWRFAWKEFTIWFWCLWWLPSWISVGAAWIWPGEFPLALAGTSLWLGRCDDPWELWQPLQAGKLLCAVWDWDVDFDSGNSKCRLRWSRVGRTDAGVLLDLFDPSWWHPSTRTLAQSLQIREHERNRFTAVKIQKFSELREIFMMHAAHHSCCPY